MMSTLNAHLWTSNHVVAQVVKAKLRVCAVGNICLIRRLFKAQSHAVLQKTNANTQELVDGTHPLTVSFSQVIVDSNNVNAFTAQRVKVTSKGGDKRLTFTGLHLCNSALVERNTTNKLNVKVTLANSSYRSLTYCCKSLWEKII